MSPNLTNEPKQERNNNPNREKVLQIKCDAPLTFIIVNASALTVLQGENNCNILVFTVCFLFN